MSKSCSASAAWRRGTAIWRWVQRYGPELEERPRRHLKPTHKSWRVDETYVRVKGRWCYLYRAIDSSGVMIDFVLSGLRDAAAAKRLFRKALTDPSYPQPRVINTGQARLYGAANDPGRRDHAHDPEGAGEEGERFGCSATDSVHQQAVRGGCMRRISVDSTKRSLTAF